MKQVRVILDQEFTSGLQGSLFQQLGHFGRVEVVNGEPLVHRRLDGMSYPSKSVAELIFNPAEASVQQGWVGQDQREEEAANLVKAVLDANEVL